jgi:hypothetical protein
MGHRDFQLTDFAGWIILMATVCISRECIQLLQMSNHSPFETAFFVFPNQQGVDTLYVVIKATFDVVPEPKVSEKQKPVVMGDEHWGEPGTSSIKYASEAHLEKPGTDVVLVGEAHAPHGKPVTELNVGLSVAGRIGGFTVFGDRYWKGGSLVSWPSKPKPFVRMPLVYERAFGGMNTAMAEKNGKIYSEPRNPVGCGFKGKRSFEEIKKEPLPNLEDRGHHIFSPTNRSRPVGFGFIASSWEPRLLYAGTYDQAWQKKRAPYLPGDFDPRFFNAAHSDWVFSRHLVGGEPVRTINLSPRGRLDFRIPRCEFSIEIDIAGNIVKPVAKLETVLLEPTDERLCLTWRAAVDCNKKSLEVNGINVSLNRLG